MGVISSEQVRYNHALIRSRRAEGSQCSAYHNEFERFHSSSHALGLKNIRFSDACTKKVMEGGGQAKMPKDDERRDAATVWGLEGGVEENQRHRR